MFGILSHSQIDPRITMVTASQLQLLQSPITALVLTHFWVPTKNKNKKPKEVRKITGGRSAQKMVGKLVKKVKNTKI